jgi:hypothetical protein
MKAHLDRLRSAGRTIVQFNTPRWHRSRRSNHHIEDPRPVDGSVGTIGGAGVRSLAWPRKRDALAARHDDRMTGPITGPEAGFG